MSNKPTIALIPSTVGGSVYSVLPSNGDGDFNFTRASAATRINAQGLIETVAVGDNRLNYPLLDGTVQTCPHLLLEPQRTNLITYSESFSNAFWLIQNSSITLNITISPDGTLNAAKLTENTSNSTHRILNSAGLTVSGDVSISVFAKKGERNWIRLTNNNIQGAFFDLDNGVVGAVTLGVDAKIENYGNGWYRCSISQTGVANERIGVYTSIDGVNTTYTGDGTSGVYIYGASLEEGSYPTSYIVSNSGSATTRLAEVCDGSGNASTFNDSEGVLMAQIGALADDGTFRVIAINGTPTNVNEDRIQIYFRDTANVINFGMESGNSTQFFLQFPLDVKLNNKLALKYSASSCSFWINGLEVGEELNKVMPTGLSRLDFAIQNGGDIFYGKTKQIQYFDSALTDSELETLTSWMSFSDMAIDLNYTIQ